MTHIPALRNLICTECAASTREVLISRRRFLRFALGAAALAATGTLAGCASGSEGAGAASAGVSGGGSAPAQTDADGSAAAAGIEQPVERTLFAFDTVVNLSLYGDEALADAMVRRCEYFESIFSRTREGSDIWRINHSGGAPVTVAPETADAINRSLEYSRQSDGLFDITIGAVSSLWDFKEGVKPGDEALAEAVSHVGYGMVAVDDTVVRLDDPAGCLDLGGIAKGYIADDLVRMAREVGCESALLNLGGNVVALGAKPDGSEWNVGIQDPNAPTAAGVIASVRCESASVVTSGLYERYFEADGKRYHHILDPRTGYPAKTDLASASIVTESSADGDALATWMFLLGEKGALEHLEENPHAEGLTVASDGTVSVTSGSCFEVR